MSKFLGALVTILALSLILVSPAEARKHRRHHHHVQVVSADPFQSFFGESSSIQAHTGMDRGQTTTSTPRFSSVRAGRYSEEGVRYLPHPSGCPARLFCGCGAAYHVFGKPIRSLWLVAEWRRRFPRASASHGMAALTGRRGGGHIVILDRQVSGSIWMVYDYNSGGHRSRYLARNIAGSTIVNPQAGRYASN